MGVRGDGSKDGEKWTDLKYILKTGWIGTLCGSLGPIQTGRCQCQLLTMTKGKNSCVKAEVSITYLMRISGTITTTFYMQ